MTSSLDRYRPLIDEWSAFSEASVEPLPTSLVVNTLRTTREELHRRLTGRGVVTTQVPWTGGLLLSQERGQPGNRFEYLAGLYNVQEEAAAIPVDILDPQPGERILDLCAAPGNKTAQIAMAMQNRGTVVANDVSYHRMRATRGLLDRFGLANVCLVTQDGRKFPRAMGQFDRVLVDAPCSCEGTSRKSPSAMRPVSVEEYEQLASVQRGLLRRALEVCAPGGVVVYSTCTYAPEENEAVVDAVLRDLSFDVEVLPCNLPGLRSSPGLVRWEGNDFDVRLERALRIWPHQNDTGGFFVCALRKALDAPHLETGDREAALAVVDPEPWMAPLRERFGWENEGFCLHEPNTKDVWIASDGIWPVPEKLRTSVGMSFLRKAMLYPKPTTGAAMLLGPRAKRNVVDLTMPQMDAFLRREDVILTAGQAESADIPGYVLVRCQDLVAGVGRLGRDGLTIESFYPKAWALGSDMSAFEESV